MASFDLHGRDLITTQEWSVEEIDTTIDYAKQLKRLYYSNSLPPILKDKTFFMLFYNTSTRTRASFESAMTNLSGHAQFIDVATTRAASGEAIKDVAAMYDRYGHGLGIRILEKAVDYQYGKGNAILREYAKYAKIPIINMADDMYHPCQGITDLMTIQEKIPNPKGKKYVILWAYSDQLRGACSIQEEMILMPRYGVDTIIACPDGFDPDPSMIKIAEKNASEAGANFEISHDYKEALKGAAIVFPRGWTSQKCQQEGMVKFGADKEQKLWDERKDWKLTMDLLKTMDRKAIVTHVLPVFRGQEATDEVMDSAHSVVYDQAENRMHSQMAILALTMGGK